MFERVSEFYLFRTHQSRTVFFVYSANCVLPASAPQEKINATLMIGCFKKHFSIVEKVEECTRKSVPTFVMPDIEQLGVNGGKELRE